MGVSGRGGNRKVRIVAGVMKPVILMTVIVEIVISSCCWETTATLVERKDHSLKRRSNVEGVAVQNADCSGTWQTLLPCLEAVEGADPAQPDSDCCSAIKDVDPDCLCNLLGKFIAAGGLEEFPEVNIDAALHLPRECGRFIPQNFECAGYVVPS